MVVLVPVHVVNVIEYRVHSFTPKIDIDLKSD